MATQELPICEAIDRAPPDSRDLVARRLREIGEPRRAFVTAWKKPSPGAMRIRDIVLTGPADDEAECVALNRRLDHDFSEARLEFRVRGAWANDAPPRAFFGQGVFAPDADDRPIADLQFAWNGQPDVADVVTPQLGGASKNDPPAAWYPGQLGVALGFDARWAPAIISRRDAPHNSPVVAALRDVVLFFGRRHAHSTPAIEAQARRTEHDAKLGVGLAPGSVSKHLQNKDDWWLRNGEWQWLELRVANVGSVTLWFRIASRTGRIHFRSFPKSSRAAPPDPSPDGTPRPRLLVRGLILPNVPNLPEFLAGFLGGRASRVVIDFDSHNRLRANEISESRSSVVVDAGSRLAVWRHAPPGSWIDKSRSLAGWQDLELDDGERVELRDFPPTWPKEPSLRRRQAIATLYSRRAWCLLQFDGDDTSFGWFGIPERGLLSGKPDLGDAPGQDEANDTPTISLDWLNRAAHVVRGGATYGLAEHYFLQSKLRTTVSVTADGLQVEAAGSGAGTVKYSISPRQVGPLGPLYVEYRHV